MARNASTSPGIAGAAGTPSGVARKPAAQRTPPTDRKLDEPNFESMLTANLLCFGRALTKQFEALLAQSETGLTSAQARIILKLHYEGPMTQKALAETTDVAPPTLTGTIEVMERDGRVSRTRNPADRRELLVELTGAGRATLPALFELFRATESWLTEGLSPGRVADLLTELSVVKDRLREYLPCGGGALDDSRKTS